MERAKLRELWLELFGQLPHPRHRREVLIPILAYRLQEKALGGRRQPRNGSEPFPLASLGPDAISAIMNNERHAHLSLNYLASQISIAWSEQCIIHSI
jgi:hypothetical protein